MRPYPVNSPQAMARILAMLLVSCESVGDKEFDRLEALDFYDILGVSHSDFMQILHEYCQGLTDEDEDGTIHLISLERINQLLDEVTDPKKRLITATIALDVVKADLEIDEAEMALFTHLMNHWHLTLDDIQATFAS